MDFDESQDKTNSTRTNTTGIANGQPEFPADGERGGSVGGTSTIKPSNTGNSGRSGPKIHGVRVTVDTGDNPKSSKGDTAQVYIQGSKFIFIPMTSSYLTESKESVEITESGGKHKKRVGIHTDITFEITGDVDELNVTDSGQRHDKGIIKL